MTVAELEERMGVGEATRWARYESRQPFLPTRIDLAAGIIASTTVNLHRGNAPAWDALDFMPLMARPTTRLTQAQARAMSRFPDPVDEDDAMLQRMVAAYG